MPECKLGSPVSCQSTIASVHVRACNLPLYLKDVFRGLLFIRTGNLPKTPTTTLSNDLCDATSARSTWTLYKPRSLNVNKSVGRNDEQQPLFRKRPLTSAEKRRASSAFYQLQKKTVLITEARRHVGQISGDHQNQGDGSCDSRDKCGAEGRRQEQ